MLTGTSCNCYLTIHDFVKRNKKYVVIEISSCSFSLNSNEREYNQQQSLNILHQERRLNIGPDSFVPCSVILVIKHLWDFKESQISDIDNVLSKRNGS